MVRHEVVAVTHASTPILEQLGKRFDVIFRNSVFQQLVVSAKRYAISYPHNITHLLEDVRSGMSGYAVVVEGGGTTITSSSSLKSSTTSLVLVFFFFLVVVLRDPGALVFFSAVFFGAFFFEALVVCDGAPSLAEVRDWYFVLHTMRTRSPRMSLVALIPGAKKVVVNPLAFVWSCTPLSEL